MGTKGGNGQSAKRLVFGLVLSGLWLAALPFLLLACVRAQDAAGNAQSFDVVSVKVNNSGNPFFQISPRKANIPKFNATNVTVKRLLAVAYGMEESLISGGPNWMETARFDIDAKGGKAPTVDELLLLVQGLLAERFMLKVHWFSTEMPVYSLVVTKDGHKLHPTTCPPSEMAPAPSRVRACGSFWFTPTGVIATGATINDLTRAVADMAGRPVIDKTKLDGRFDFTLIFRLMFGKQGGEEQIMDGRSDLPSTSIFYALPEQLGLKLLAGRESVNHLIVDHVEMPSAN